MHVGCGRMNPTDNRGTSVQRKILIAGHSHVYALQFSSFTEDPSPAFVRLPNAPDSIRGFATHAGPYDPSYWDALVAHADDWDVLILWQGSQHLSEFLFNYDQPFDFMVATHPALPLVDGARLVPETLVREHQCRFLVELDSVLLRLAKRNAGRVFICETPPPKGDNFALRKLMLDEPYFQERAKAFSLDIAQIPLSPPIIRLKLWIVVYELIKELADKYGAGYISVPTSVKDELGFLRPEYWEHDVGHGNNLYGSELLREILDRMST